MRPFEQGQRVCEVQREGGVAQLARAHLAGRDDDLVRTRPLLDIVNDWDTFLRSDDNSCDEAIRLHQRTGRPLGGSGFIDELSALTGRELHKRKPGRKHQVS